MWPKAKTFHVLHRLCQNFYCPGTLCTLLPCRTDVAAARCVTAFCTHHVRYYHQLHMVNSPFTFWIDYNQGAFLEFHNTFGILSTHCAVWEFGRSKSFRMFVLAAILKNRKQHRMYRPCWNPPFSYNCTAHARLSSSPCTQFSVRKWYFDKLKWAWCLCRDSGFRH